MYRKVYFTDLSDSEFEEAQAHVGRLMLKYFTLVTRLTLHSEHCLDWLRVAALCRGDTTLTTLNWNKEGPVPYLDSEYPIPRRCIDWERLLDWSEARSVDSALVAPPEDPSSKV